MDHFDLTTFSGRQEATNRLGLQGKRRYQAASTQIHALPIPSYPAHVASKLADRLGRAWQQVFDSSRVINSQREMVEAIIRSGRENGAKGLRIEVDQQAGVDLGSTFEGIPMKIAMGTRGKMVIEITYE